MKLELKNIGGLGGVHEYDLQTGVNRITGPSESGKSSIIRGIECLIKDDNDLFRRTLNDDNEVGYVKFGDYERNLQRVDAKAVNASIDDKTFYGMNKHWAHVADIVFFTPESYVVIEIEQGRFDVRRYIERISIVDILKVDIFRKEQQLDGMKKELEQYIDSLTRAQELESDIEMIEGEIKELQEKEVMLKKEVVNETGNRSRNIIISDIAIKKQEIREKGVGINCDIVTLKDELKALQKECSEVMPECKDELKRIQAMIGGFENEIKTKRRDIGKHTGCIPDFIIGESLEDYANKKNSAFEMLRNDVAAFKNQYKKEMFGAIDVFNSSALNIFNNLGMRGFNKLEIVKKMCRDELESLDLIVQHESGKEQSIDTLTKREQLMLSLVFQIAVKDNYMPDFPFFVIDEKVNEYQEIYEGVLKYLSEKAEYVLISQNVAYSKQKELVIKYGIT